MPTAHILVVDDQLSARGALCSTLTHAGYRCNTAESGAHALALLQDDRHDLIFSDLNMPQMGGLALLSAVKEAWPDVPVVMITGVHDISVGLDAIRNGAYDYLLKPFNRDQLLATARRALEYQRLKLENRRYQENLEALIAARTEQLRQAVAMVEKSYDTTLEALGDALDLKDSETEGHSKRVTAFTIAIARAMGLTVDQIRVIARAAFLHDIGKMAIPDAILRKPGPLDSAEQVVMRQHCYRGYQILKKIPFLSDAADIVYAHQEKFDGTGYPRGLKGEEIPLGARIFSVADTLDAITSDRPYRTARSLSVAYKEILAWSGRQFDPAVVKTFVTIPGGAWEDLRQGISSTKCGTDFALSPTLSL